MNDPSSEPDLLDRLAHEFAERCRRGEQPALTEYADRHPALAADIRELFPALAEMEALGSSGGSGPAVLVAEAPTRLGEYRILREVGRGGMGVVYEAIQESLGRHVALKVLPARAGNRGNALERFKREARAAANLHHTNIVPVFGVGEADGVHYYAMQFIAGQGLDAVLDELRRLRDKSPAPNADLKTVTLANYLVSGQFPSPAAEPVVPANPMAATRSGPAGSGSTVLSGSSDLARGPDHRYFRTVARLGAQVADALAYAHSQGVLHRDVKPSNLLLDAHGTLWVTDFGLAKVEGTDELTSPGDVVGTVRYMAPERFRGQADARSDVYGVGLTLYELLTLRPAFDDPDRLRLIDQIRAEDPLPPRSIDPRIPRDLELIVRKATTRHPDERYSTAAELATDLGRFLRDEPVRARRPTAVLRVRKWARRNRTVVTAGSLGLVLALAALAGSIGWAMRDQAARQAGIDADADRALQDADRLQRAGRYADAQGAIALADSLLARGGRAESLEWARDLRANLDTVARLEEIRLRHWETKVHDFAHQDPEPAYAAAFRAHGLDPAFPDPAAAAELVRASPIRDELTAAFDDWAWARARSDPAGRDRLLAVARRADPDEWRDWLRDATAHRDRASLERLAGRAEIRAAAPATVVLLGRMLADAGARPRAIDVLAAARVRHPDDFWLNYELSRHLIMQGHTPAGVAEALSYARSAQALRPNNGRLHSTVANRLWSLGRVDEAIAGHRRAVELAPDDAVIHYSLGRALATKGNWDEAIAAYEDARRLDPEALEVSRWLPVAYKAVGRWDASEATLRDLLRRAPTDYDALQQLAWDLATHPDVARRDGHESRALALRAVELRPDIGNGWNALGTACYRVGDYEGAIKNLEKARTFFQGGGAYEWYFLAMAHWQLHNGPQALHWHARASQWMKTSEKWLETNPVAKSELNRIRTEAAEVLGLSAVPNSGDKDGLPKRP